MPDVVLRWHDGAGAFKSAPGGGKSDIDAAFADGATWLWADVTDPDPDTLDALCDRFGFHPLALEDTQHPQRSAKLDQYPDGLFLVWLTPEHPEGDGIVGSELDVFVGSDHLVTVHTERCKAIDSIAESGAKAVAAGPAWVLHRIIDILVDSTLPLVDDIGEQLEAIEDTMLDNPRQEDLLSLHQVRRQLVHLHRIVAPERDMLRGLARESTVISTDAYSYFQDVGDHISRALDSIETYQDVAASVMDVYLSAQSNRMNEIMKQLTVVATIFMPLTLISGIYGMNVILGMWPPVNAVWSFWAVMGLMLAIAGSMAVYFRRNNWW
jgi:magnesium transporter